MRRAAGLVGVVSALLTACSGSDGDDEEASAPDRDERSWDAIDPCTLLSADALTAAGVQDATGVREAPPDPPDRPVGFPGSLGPLCRGGGFSRNRGLRRSLVVGSAVPRRVR